MFRHRARTALVAAALAAAPAAVLAAAPAALGAEAAATKPASFAGSLGTTVPKGATVRVRAIDRARGTVADSATAGRAGAFRLTMPAGVYLVVASVVPREGRIVQTKVGVSLKAGQKRVRATLNRRKNRRPAKKAVRPRAREAYVQELGQVTPGKIAVELHDVQGRSRDADWNAVRPGINDVLLYDAMNAVERCGGGVSFIEVDRRADIIKELEFQQSIYVDPATRVTRNFILGDVEVRGTSTDVPGAPGSGDVTLRIRDRRSGAELGRLTQRVRPDSFFDDLQKLGTALGQELCTLTDVYEVSLDVQGTGRFATHDGSASLRSTVLATRGPEGGGMVWRGSGQTAWQNLAFTSKTDCSYLNPITANFDWSVTIIALDPATLQVLWQQDNGGIEALPTASVLCPGDPTPPPIPGQPGPSLTGGLPETFTLPAAGGSHPVPNGVTDDGSGFFNTGTITITPKGAARKRT